MTMTIRLPFLCIPLLLGLPMALPAQTKTCSPAEQKQAIMLVARDWESLYSSFKRLGHCDDGAPAENFSEIVVGLLASDWRHFGDLRSRTTSDKKFQRF